MSGNWLTSYGVLWGLLSLNFVLACAIANLLVRVRSRWFNDARSFAIPFTGKDWLPLEPNYTDVSGISSASGTQQEENEKAEGIGTLPPVALVDATVSRLIPAERPVERRENSSIVPVPAAARSQQLDSVSVVIPTADSPKLLGSCLKNLRQAQGRLRLQVLCVFSETPTLSREVCNRYGARTLRARGRFSFPRSINVGLAEATEPLILLLNNDVHWRSFGDLERLAVTLQGNPQLGAIGPVSDNIGSAGQRREAADPSGGLVHPDYALIGHCVLLRREMLDAVGTWDEGFSAYGYDEVDWFWRAGRQGYRWSADERVWVHHAGSASFSEDRVREGLPLNRTRFQQKWEVDPQGPGVWEWPSPLLSVVMTAFNCEPWLDRCFSSIMNAGLSDYEVICVDDASGDATGSVIRRWAKLLPLKYARFTKADNVARAKNRALRMASGRYIALMDADDEMPEERIPFLMGTLEDTGADLAYGGFELRPEKAMDYAVAKMIPADPWDLRNYATTETNWVCPCSTLFRREILDAGIFFDEGMPAFEDYEWILAVGSRGFQITPAPGPSCHTYHQRRSTTLESYEWSTLRDGIRRKYGLPTGVVRPESAR